MGNELSTTLPEDWATIDMVNRFTFCPSLFHLIYAEGRWADNVHTLGGKAAHRRVDRIDQLLSEADPPSDVPADPEEGDGDEPPEIARSVSLGSDTLGLMGKLDLVAADPSAREAAPVETKKGRVPNVPERTRPLGCPPHLAFPQILPRRKNDYFSTSAPAWSSGFPPFDTTAQSPYHH